MNKMFNHKKNNCNNNEFFRIIKILTLFIEFSSQRNTIICNILLKKKVYELFN